MEKQKRKTEVFGSNLTEEQRMKAEKLGINLSSPNQIIILTQNGEFKLKTTKKTIADYSNGLLAMHIQIALTKLGTGSRVVNDNIPLKIKEVRGNKKRVKAPTTVPVATNPTQSKVQ